MIWPTRLRGFSDAYGSWKIICICAAQRAQARAATGRPAPAPRNRTDPEVGVRQLQDRPAQRRLAAAGFADQAQRLALVAGSG